MGSELEMESLITLSRGIDKPGGSKDTAPPAPSCPPARCSGLRRVPPFPPLVPLGEASPTLSFGPPPPISDMIEYGTAARGMAAKLAEKSPDLMDRRLKDPVPGVVAADRGEGTAKATHRGGEGMF